METEEQVRQSVGMDPEQQRSPELPAAAIQPLAQEVPTAASVTAGATGLAWWDAAKYEWRRAGSGNTYLAAQAVYVADVLDRGDHYLATIAGRLGKDDYKAFDDKVEHVVADIQLEDAYDTTGVEGQGLRRYYLNRLILARKICGATACSAEHRTINEMSRKDGDVEKMQGDSEGYYAADVEKRESWGLKAVRLEYICKGIADGDVIPIDEAEFSQLLAKRITSSLGDDAFEQGRKLRRPPQQAQNGAAKPTREELLAMTA